MRRTKDQQQPASASASPRFDRPTLLGAATIGILTILIYLPAIRGGFIWDDPQYIVNNSNLRDLQGLFDTWTKPRSLPQWYPLVHTIFWTEYQLWELHPLGYHLNNVLLHIAGSLLLWRLLKQLQVPGAWLAAVIFAVHPVQVESVAWVTERKNVLSGVFYFAALIVYMRFVEIPAKKRLWVGAFVLFFLGLLSKSVIATMPAAILVILWWKNGTIRWKDVWPLLPFFVLGASMGLFTAYLETHHVGAQSDRISELQLEPLDRLLIAGRAVWFYARKLIVPWPLVFIYPQWKGVDWRVAGQWIYPIGVALVITLLVLNRKRLGRGPAAAAMIFCGTLFPALGFLNVYPMRFSYVADHFQYHASAALIALFAALLWNYAGRYAAVVLIPLLFITAIQTPVYKDAETLWRATLARNEQSWMIHTNLGQVLMIRGEQSGDQRLIDEADGHFERALELAPDVHDTRADMAMSLGRRGRHAEALREFDEALKLAPHFAPALYGIGQIHQEMGDIDKAIDYFQRAIQSHPNYGHAHYRLGLAWEQKGNFPEAVEHYRQAVASMPEDADARYNLGSLLIRLREPGEAAYNLMEAVRIRPNWAQAWSNLGLAQLLAGRRDDAVRSLQTALRINPDLAQARTLLEQINRR